MSRKNDKHDDVAFLSPRELIKLHEQYQADLSKGEEDVTRISKQIDATDAEIAAIRDRLKILGEKPELTAKFRRLHAEREELEENLEDIEAIILKKKRNLKKVKSQLEKARDMAQPIKVEDIHDIARREVELEEAEEEQDKLSKALSDVSRQISELHACLDEQGCRIETQARSPFIIDASIKAQEVLRLLPEFNELHQQIQGHYRHRDVLLSKLKKIDNLKKKDSSEDVGAVDAEPQSETKTNAIKNKVRRLIIQLKLKDKVQKQLLAILDGSSNNLVLSEENDTSDVLYVLSKNAELVPEQIQLTSTLSESDIATLNTIMRVRSCKIQKLSLRKTGLYGDDIKQLFSQVELKLTELDLSFNNLHYDYAETRQGSNQAVACATLNRLILNGQIKNLNIAVNHLIDSDCCALSKGFDEAYHGAEEPLIDELSLAYSTFEQEIPAFYCNYLNLGKSTFASQVKFSEYFTSQLNRLSLLGCNFAGESLGGLFALIDKTVASSDPLSLDFRVDQFDSAYFSDYLRVLREKKITHFSLDFSQFTVQALSVVCDQIVQFVSFESTLWFTDLDFNRLPDNFWQRFLSKGVDNIRLSFENCRHIDLDVIVKYAKNLTYLNLSFCEETRLDFTSFRHQQRLTTLSISCIGQEASEMMAGLRQLIANNRLLTKLCLTGVQWTSQQVIEITEMLADHQHLKTLRLVDCEHEIDADVVFGHFADRNQLDLLKPLVNTDGFTTIYSSSGPTKALSNFEEGLCKRHKAACISAQALKGGFFSRYPSANLTANLLHFQAGHWDADTLERFVGTLSSDQQAVSRLASVTKLSFRKNHLGPSVGPLLSRLIGLCPNLTAIDLVDTQISVDVVQSVVTALNDKTLAEFDISDNALSAAATSAIMQPSNSGSVVAARRQGLLSGARRGGGGAAGYADSLPRPSK